ncbi:MAG: hypothetical protein HONBIEJF_02866 [Fimbriimonadaceae bacterium]|nr:hypothetical protein [Fimbriimonadaceae bacterium]
MNRRNDGRSNLSKDYGKIRPGHFGPILDLRRAWSPEVAKYMKANRITGLWLDYSEDWHDDNIDFILTIDNLLELVIFFHGYYPVISFGDNGLASGMKIVRAEKDYDLTPISELKLLKRLQLSVFGKPRLSFDGLVSLQECWVDWSAGYESLLQLKSLQSLTINSTPANLIPKISALTSLVTLCLMSCKAANLDDLVALSKLEYLELARFKKLKDVDFIASLTSLKHLNLRNCGGCSCLRSLEGLPKLEVVVLDDLGLVESLDPLVNLGTLRKVVLMGKTRLVEMNSIRTLREKLPSVEIV